MPAVPPRAQGLANAAGARRHEARRRRLPEERRAQDPGEVEQVGGPEGQLHRRLLVSLKVNRQSPHFLLSTPLSCFVLLAVSGRHFVWINVCFPPCPSFSRYHRHILRNGFRGFGPLAPTALLSTSQWHLILGDFCSRRLIPSIG